jgi:hypothetical protein
MNLQKKILTSLGRYAMQSMMHRHVFATDDLQRFATTKSIGPFHNHKIHIKGRWIETDIARSGPEHRHKVVMNGKELLSGLPVEGMSTDLF